jgi:CheY-like chemotaxis protein
MPAVGGVEAAARIREGLPNARIVFLSEYSEVGLPAGSMLVRKPFQVSELLEFARHALAAQDAA